MEIMINLVVIILQEAVLNVPLLQQTQVGITHTKPMLSNKLNWKQFVSLLKEIRIEITKC